jgi:hypothetical protein
LIRGLPTGVVVTPMSLVGELTRRILEAAGQRERELSPLFYRPWCRCGRGAEIIQDALLTKGPSRHTHIAAMEDHAQGERGPVRTGKQVLELSLDQLGRDPRDQAKPARNPDHMPVGNHREQYEAATNEAVVCVVRTQPPRVRSTVQSS